MSECKALSFTTWKGCLFSETQQMHHTLKCIFNLDMCRYSDLLCLQFGECMQAVCHGDITITILNLFKCCNNWPIQTFVLWQSWMHSPNIPCCICSVNNWFPSANLHMSVQNTCWAGVACVQIVSDVLGLAVTTCCYALEDMCLLALKILNASRGFKENINGCVPLLWQAI